MIRLAVAASDALIVDVDKQRSATSWWRSREVEMPALATATTSGVEEAIGTTRRDPVPGQEFADPLGGMIGQPRQHIGEPGLRIDAVQLGAFD